ncbi:MAG: PEP-CTERM sorting domain-containing protein [Akkermansiaceae bacterium]
MYTNLSPRRSSLAKWLILPAAQFILSQSAMGAITVHFVDEITAVRVSFSGTLDLTGSPGTVSTINQSSNNSVGPDRVTTNGPGYGQNMMGTHTVSPLSLTFISGALTIPGVIGFNSDTLFWNAQHISAGVPGGTVTELTANPADDTMLLSFSTMASLNADAASIAEGTVLWTSNGTAGDQFIFSRLSPVPEPSSALLMSTCGLALLRRRRSTVTPIRKVSRAENKCHSPFMPQ